MKKRNTIFIISLISVALVGFIIIQGYWIKNAYNVRQGDFVRLVNEAAHETIVNLEKQEVAERINENLSKDLSDSEIMHSIDSVNQALLKEMQSINTRKELEIFFNKYFMTKELMENMMIMPKELPFEKRVSFGTIDSMLTVELVKRNLNIPFDFGVYNPYRDRMVMQKTGNHNKELLDAQVSFHFELFPDDMQEHPDYLLLYFPGEKKFLISQVWPVLIISILLVLVIIISFTYTLFLLFRQKKLSEMKTDLINNMTHEFKTPVSTISLACEALNDHDIQKSEELYKSYIQIISEENHRLGMMSERILQSAALEQGEIVLRKEEVDIHDVLDDVSKNIGIQVEIKDGQIIKDFRASNSMVFADRMHIVNVVQNLLDNANKYSPAKPHIEISTFDRNDGIVFSIKDNGIGISKSDQKKIFEKLYRVPEGNVHNFKGFGLGLSYVKTIVEKHGGSIKLESEPNKGTTFEVYLPRDHQDTSLIWKRKK